MEPNLFEDLIWYEDSLVGMMETRASKKKKDETDIKDELTNSVDNQSIRFYKALQTFQCLTPDEMVRVIEEVHNLVGPTPQASSQVLEMPRNILVWSDHYNSAIIKESVPQVICGTYLSPSKLNK